MYQPLKPQAGYTIPPQSNNMLLTAGTAYHSKPRSSNLGYLYATKIHCQHAPLIEDQEFTIYGPFTAHSFHLITGFIWMKKSG